MKTIGKRLLSIFALVALTVCLTEHSEAAMLFTISQGGGNVVVSGSGSINTGGLTLAANGDSGDFLDSSIATLLIGSPVSIPIDRIYNGGGLTGPSNFGSGINYSADSGTGNYMGIAGDFSSLGDHVLLVPFNYVSGAPLAGTSTFNNQTFVTLGIIPGTYVYTWGSGANADSLTINAVPEPSIWALLGVGAGVLGVSVLRRLQVRCV